MDPDLTYNEFMIEDGHETDRYIADAEEVLGRAHSFYKDVLKVVVQAAIRNRMLLDAENVQCTMEAVQEGLYNESCVDGAVSTLKEHGVEHSIYPHDCDTLCADAAEQIIDAFRVKPVSLSEIFDDVFGAMAQATRSYIPHNPGTVSVAGVSQQFKDVFGGAA